MLVRLDADTSVSTSGGLIPMKSSLLNSQSLLGKLIRPIQSGVLGCVSSLQHVLMAVAVAASLKLCMFTARVLLSANAEARQQANQPF